MKVSLADLYAKELKESIVTFMGRWWQKFLYEISGFFETQRFKQMSLPRQAIQGRSVNVNSGLCAVVYVRSFENRSKR